MKRNIELEASEVLLDRGTSVPLIRLKLPFVRRVLQFHFVLKRPCLGSQIRIDRLYLKMGVSFEQIEEMTREEEMAFVARHGKTCSWMLALTICRGFLSGVFLAPIMAWVIRWMTPPELVLELNLRYVWLLGAKDFTTIIRSARTTGVTRPRLSQRKRGS